ncbi:hypothetical protein K438DRAFT_1751286 [Mycena galopus ATCC 62051]|nr:hypothetical protein K438DRAFT_1751286 [Mycena galopus ATCC 62051]
MAKIFGDTEDILIYAAEDVEHGPTLHALGHNKAKSDERMAGEHVKKFCGQTGSCTLWRMVDFRTPSGSDLRIFATLVNCYSGGGGSLLPLQIISLSDKWIQILWHAWRHLATSGHLSTPKTGSRIDPIFGRSSDAPGLTSSHKASKPSQIFGFRRALALAWGVRSQSQGLKPWLAGNLTLAGSSKDPKNDQPLEATDQALVAKSREGSGKGNSQVGLATEDDAHHIPQQSLAMSPRTKYLRHTPPVREATARIAKAAEQQLGFENLKQPGTREEDLEVLRHGDEKVLRHRGIFRRLGFGFDLCCVQPALDGQSIWKNGRAS